MRKPFALVLLGLLIGCQPRPAPEVEGKMPVPDEVAWPQRPFPRSADVAGSVFELEATNSRVDILVRRAGPLARFGHDHVIVADDIRGYVLLAPRLAQSRAEIRLPLKALKVDPPAARNRYDVESEPSDEAVAATRRNMLNKVLAADQWPYVDVRIENFSRRGDHYTADVELSVRDSTRRQRETFELEMDGPAILARGSISVNQSELGLRPFAALGGGLRVADRLEIHFRFEGREY